MNSQDPFIGPCGILGTVSGPVEGLIFVEIEGPHLDF